MKSKRKRVADRSPGPWHTFECRYHDKAPAHQVQIRDKNNNIIAVTASYGMHAGAPLDPSAIEKNGRLLGAASVLLGAVDQALSAADFGEDIDWEMLERAYKQATGRARRSR